MPYCAHAAAKAVLAASLLLAPFAATAQPAMQRAAGIGWICAGVGTDERRALDALRPQAALEILFVTAKRGSYLAGAELSLYAGRGGQPLLHVGADGPVCLIDAPPGTYRLEATYDGVTRTARATIAKAGAPPRKVVLAFPEEPWDGIRASPEEKAQAAQP